MPLKRFLKAAAGPLALSVLLFYVLDAAIGAFQRAVDADPRSAHAEQNLARALLSAGRRDDARRHAERAATLDPEAAPTPLKFDSYRWQQHCRGLYQTPIAA